MKNYTKRIAFPVSLLVIASVLVFVSFPRFIASVKVLYPAAVLIELSAGKEFPERTFLEAQNDLISALEWHDSSYYWRQLGELRFKYIFQYITDLEDFSGTLAEASATTDLALSLMPVAPYTWYDRAVINSMDQEELEQALESLAMSVYVDRININLLKARVLFLWDNIDSCDEELLSIFRSQLLLFWELRPWLLVQVIKANPEMESWLVAGLSTSPDDLVTLNRKLNK